MIKSEQDEDPQSTITSQIHVEFESIPQTPIEKARAKLTTALERERTLPTKKKEIQC